jgi:hypothetical protein
VRLARLKRHAQRHAVAQQVLLANDLAQSSGAQAFSKGGMGCVQKKSLSNIARSVAICHRCSISAVSEGQN